MPKLVKRYTRVCNGKCGIIHCNFATDKKRQMLKHLGKLPRSVCPKEGCQKHYAFAFSLRHHVYNKHPELALRLFGPRIMRDKKINMPDSFSGKIHNCEYFWIVKMVRTCITADIRKKSAMSSSSLLKLRSMVNETEKVGSNVICHKIAKSICERLILMKNTDDFGGFLPNGFLLQRHGGIFQLSLDRIRNKCILGKYNIHFPSLDNVFENIRLIALGMNVSGIEGLTIEDVQNAVSYNPSDEYLQHVYAYESKLYKKCISGNASRWRRTTISMSANGIIKNDHLCREEFKTVYNFHKYMLERLISIKCRCEISGIVMKTNEESSPYNISIDAICPVKGHVRGNMRLICRFLNSTNLEKVKKSDHILDGPSSWTPELFRKYFRIE